MSNVGLGRLDESSLMVMFGTCHSRYLTTGIGVKPNKILDSKDNILYPAYFMTNLEIPAQYPLSEYKLWDTITIDVSARRFGSTILDSTYILKSEDNRHDTGVCMSANSVFIHDPAIYRAAERQVSAPKPEMIRKMDRMQKSPLAIQEAARARSGRFATDVTGWLEGERYYYQLISGRDTSAGHPLMFAKYPQLISFAEHNYLKMLTNGKASDRILDSASLLQRKIFYFGNAFAGRQLSFFTKGLITKCTESLWKENPKVQYLFNIELLTEVYDEGELLSLSHARKVISHKISDQSSIQDSNRLFNSVFTNQGVKLSNE